VDPIGAAVNSEARVESAVAGAVRDGEPVRLLAVRLVLSIQTVLKSRFTESSTMFVLPYGASSWPISGFGQSSPSSLSA
jgi:hypothetical protein